MPGLSDHMIESVIFFGSDSAMVLYIYGISIILWCVCDAVVVEREWETEFLMNAFSSCGVDPIEKAWKSAWRQSTHILCNKVFFWIHILEVPHELFKS